MRQHVRALTIALLVPLLSSASPQQDFAEPYRILQQANRLLDPNLAASAYTSGARLIFERPGETSELFQGRNEIRQAYVRTFGQVDTAPIALDFRFHPPGIASKNQKGFYRLKARAGGKPVMVYGSFVARLRKENGKWRFAEDRGTTAAAKDFDRLPPAHL